MLEFWIWNLIRISKFLSLAISDGPYGISPKRALPSSQLVEVPATADKFIPELL